MAVGAIIQISLSIAVDFVGYMVAPVYFKHKKKHVEKADKFLNVLQPSTAQGALLPLWLPCPTGS